MAPLYIYFTGRAVFIIQSVNITRVGAMNNEACMWGTINLYMYIILLSLCGYCIALGTRVGSRWTGLDFQPCHWNLDNGCF